MAGDDDQSDPFLWDEDRVVRELCTAQRTWAAPPANRWPDSVALETKLRECGVDGETLLTYADEFDFRDLWSQLGVRSLPHQVSLKKAIQRFRKASAGYREWKRQELANNQSCGDQEDDNPAVKLESKTVARLEPIVQASPVTGVASTDLVSEPRLKSPYQGVLSPTLSPSAGPDALASSGIPDADADALSLEQENAEERPKKKRRLAPITISAEPTGQALSNLPTQADGISQRTAEIVFDEGDSSAFLGTSILLVDELTRPELVGQTDAADPEFVLLRKQIPAGRRIQVSAAMKRFFRSNLVQRLKQSRSENEDAPLPVFGESDDEESLDSETWREYQKEEEERLALAARKDPAKAAKERLLSKEEVAEVVRNVIQELDSRWLIEKKPKWDRKAWPVWQDSRRNPDRLARIKSEKQFLGQLHRRIARFTDEIIGQQWSVENNVQQKAVDYLERSVFDKKYQEWLIDVLESPRQPPKPATLPRPAKKPVESPVLDEDEELLASDSDGLDDFIEYDDVVVPSFGDDMEVDPEPPLEQLEQGAVPASSGRADSVIPIDEADNGLPPVDATPSGEPVVDDGPQVQPTPKKIKAEKSLAPATPRPVSTSAPKEIIVIPDSPSPVKPPGQVPGFDDLESLEKIGEIGVEHWQRVRDAERLVVAALCDWSDTKKAKLHDAIKDRDHKEAWAEYVSPTLEDPSSATAESVGFLLCRLFDTFASKSAKCSTKPLADMSCKRILREGHSFAGFYEFLGQVLQLFLHLSPRVPNVLQAQLEETPAEKETEAEGNRDLAEDLSISEESAADDMPVPSSKKRRKRKRRDRKAQDLRSHHRQLNEELARRERQFHEKMAEQGSIPGNKTRLIVNVTKESDDLPFIYINDHIGRKIKDHQIEGVRFMWNQLVVDSRVRQGCLLAHTMGLGKTMQVITLLVVIAEASASPDESVRSQIPESLRVSKTLILCPSSLVDNWSEEIAIWAPDGSLGRVQKLYSSLLPNDRATTLRLWASSGGVLIIGYSLFTSLTQSDEETAKLLQETPNLVIGDEAHYMKNPGSQRHQATANFKTMSRIAMTGSPLTNNVMDYYAMINWVAPNYLADIAEFRDRFEKPIREGLWADSEPQQKRRARRMLHVLKATVEPKVHRRDIQVLRNELPTKKEFILTLPLTKVQMDLYKTYIEWVTERGSELMNGQARAWSLVAKLGYVLAHPIIFKTTVEAGKTKPHGSKVQSSKPPRVAQAEDSDEENVEMPQDVLIKMMAVVRVREIENYALSNKILVLLRILDECKKVGDKVLVFSQSIPTLNYIENIFKRQRVVYQRLDGNTPMNGRQDSIRKFNADGATQVYLISTKAGGIGLNIHGANRVVIFDFKYTPTDEQQAIGRAYRLGQTKPVYVYWLTIGGTFEDTIHNNAVFKTQLASRVVDKKNPDPWSRKYTEWFVMPKMPDQEDLSGALGQDQVLDALLNSQDIGKLIRKITSTETFEKEEKDELTPEEKREAEEEVEIERLRLQNPEEFRRRELERIRQPRSTAVPLPSPPNPYQPPGRSIDASQLFNPSSLYQTVVPNSAPPAVVQVSPGQPSAGNQQPTTVPNEVRPNDATAEESKAAAPVPILASGSHFKSPSTRSPSAAPSGPSSLQAVEATHLEFPELLSVHHRLCQEGRHVKHHPNDLVSRVKGVWAQNKIEHLPLMDKMQNLKKFSRDPRFAEAMLSGYMEPEQLASLTRLQMERIATSLSGLAEAEFKQRVWTGKADINQTPAQLSIKTERRTVGSAELNGPLPTLRDRPTRGFLRFIDSEPDEPPTTPQDRPRSRRPGDSAKSPQVIE
ncbi:uncharacterized protein B0T15DRAFT_292378 [Chaetomium strumarium]|uniref:Uncharacterized protein n=1 Tax=Chaetomium strumarium TaxID=1170767 RepID=A0AAJ0LYA8_9PEZI|nr:hypothetical protein B0T15DRAFT_292378 [Chaetomium strumarium]